MGARIAIIEKCPSNNKFNKYIEEEFDQFFLSSVKLTKVLKRDVDIVFDPDEYEYVILVGSEPTKYFCKNSSVTEHAGLLLQDKFIPMLNPAMLHFKPEIKEAFEATLSKIKRILSGEQLIRLDGAWSCLRDTASIKQYLLDILHGDSEDVELDTETTSLYPRDGHVIGISISDDDRKAGYFDTDFFDEECTEILQQIINTKEIVFHNSKFDMKMLSYHFNLAFRLEHTYDTLVEHYILDETQGSHGLKSLAIKFTDFGDYDKELDDFKKSYCKACCIKEEDFTYDLIPWEIISKYGCIDTAATRKLHHKFWPIIEANPKLLSLYKNIMMPGIFALNEIEENGIPIDKGRLEFAQEYLHQELLNETAKLYSHPQVTQLEADQGERFNPNSVVQLRKLLFDYAGLAPTGKMTDTGAHSTDAEVLEELAYSVGIKGIKDSAHYTNFMEVEGRKPTKQDLPLLISKYVVNDGRGPDKFSEDDIKAEVRKFGGIAYHIHNIRRLSKLKNTYVEKILPGIDFDGRIRTFFNLTSTTSGRLSSSGKFNAQQIPRDDPIIKGSIKARPGYVIVSQDLATAEMYYAAVLSKDKGLQKVFSMKGDFHSNICSQVFNLNCLVEEIKKLYPEKRQATKAVSFGIK